MGLKKMLRRQLQLCQESYGVDPRFMAGDERADYAMRCVVALEHELHEALDEIRWKPWTSERRGDWVNHPSNFIEELVDVQHFVLQLLLLAGFSNPDIDELAEEFEQCWFEKAETNSKRQEEGYDGHISFKHTPEFECEHGNPHSRCMMPTCLQEAMIRKTHIEAQKNGR